MAARDTIVGTHGPLTAEAHTAQLQYLAAAPPARLTQAARRMQRRYGNRYVAQVAAQARQIIHPKLIVRPAGDTYEQEAEQVARAVIPPLTPAAPIPSSGQSEGFAAPSEVESAIQQARHGGQPLPAGVREPMQQALGRSFADVRVHTDSTADQLNRSLQARAFTTGADIFFRQGEYSPGSHAGQRLLAHELTHVVQQQGQLAAVGGELRQSGLHVPGDCTYIQAQFDWEGHIKGQHLSFGQLNSEKENWKAQRKSYLDAIKKRGSNLDEELQWGKFATNITASEGQSTVAIAADYQSQTIYIGIQQGAQVHDKQTLIDEAYRLGAFYAPKGGGWKFVMVGGAQAGLHGEMQIVAHFLAQGRIPPAMHFAAGGKACCLVCAGMIQAMGGTCEKVGKSPYEYMWSDPFAFYPAVMKHHPIFKDVDRIDKYGADCPYMRT
jgi:hypothetical protein